ncbi:MAG: TolC family protein [Candidatus Aminicenantes bacterium]|nr:TolC family protein [Candidatus Aminicenantes bacterium]
MRQMKNLWALGLLAAFAGPAFGQDSPRTLRLSLEEAVLRALKNNLSVKVAEFGPESAELSVQRAREKYYPTMAFSFSKRNSENASYSWLDASDSVRTKTTGYTFGQVNQTIPLGGRLTLGLTGNINDTNQRAQVINPRYSSTLSLGFSQPLLRDFGLKMTNRDIVVARNNLEVSELSFVKTVQDTVYTVEQTYWNLVYAVENLKVQEKSLQLARDFLAKNRRSVEIGTLAPMDVLSAEAEVANREASILSAQSQVRNYEDQLRNLMNLSADEEKGLAAILPTDTPKFEERQVDFDLALAVALEKRTDLRISKINLRTDDLNFAYAKNQLLPSLSLNASYSSPGIAGTRIIYQGSPLDGLVVNTIPGGFSDAFRDAFGFRYSNWNVSLSLDVPLSNLLSKANYAQSKLALDRARLELENQERSAVLEIRNVVRQLQTSYKLVQANKVARELAEKKLAAEEAKLQVGQTTNYVVLQYQRDLTSSRVAELNAIINYNIAQAGLDRAMGTLLESRNIRLAELFD